MTVQHVNLGDIPLCPDIPEESRIVEKKCVGSVGHDVLRLFGEETVDFSALSSPMGCDVGQYDTFTYYPNTSNCPTCPFLAICESTFFRNHGAKSGQSGVGQTCPTLSYTSYTIGLAVRYA